MPIHALTMPIHALTITVQRRVSHAMEASLSLQAVSQMNGVAPSAGGAPPGTPEQAGHTGTQHGTVPAGSVARFLDDRPGDWMDELIQVVDD